MAEVERDGDAILIGAGVRIEAGPPLLTAIATEELLSNGKTAEHYYAGTREVGGKQVVGVDALGKPIVLGEEFAYLDWGGSEADGKRGFYVFEKVELTDEDRNKPGAETTDTFRWIERGYRATEEGAISLGQQIAGA